MLVGPAQATAATEQPLGATEATQYRPATAEELCVTKRFVVTSTAGTAAAETGTAWCALEAAAQDQQDQEQEK